MVRTAVSQQKAWRLVNCVQMPMSLFRDAVQKVAEFLQDSSMYKCAKMLFSCDPISGIPLGSIHGSYWFKFLSVKRKKRLWVFKNLTQLTGGSRVV